MWSEAPAALLSPNPASTSDPDPSLSPAAAVAASAAPGAAEYASALLVGLGCAQSSAPAAMAPAAPAMCSIRAGWVAGRALGTRAHAAGACGRESLQLGKEGRDKCMTIIASF